MAKKLKKIPSCIAKENYHNLPTNERSKRGDVKIRQGSAYAEDPLRIDKLLTGGIIDELQHLYGMQIITLWTITTRPMLRSTRMTRAWCAVQGLTWPI